jgi:MFS family permease
MEITPINAAQVLSRRRTLVLGACLMATFMAAVESTIVATAMPTIVADLGGFSLFSWVFAVYLLTQAVSIPVYGRLADIYGRKKVFYVGAGLFLVGSTFCGFAPNMVALILFRALQGFGAGVCSRLPPPFSATSTHRANALTCRAWCPACSVYRPSLARPSAPFWCRR